MRKQSKRYNELALAFSAICVPLYDEKIPTSVFPLGTTVNSTAHCFFTAESQAVNRAYDKVVGVIQFGIKPESIAAEVDPFRI